MQLEFLCFQEMVLKCKNKLPDWEMIAEKMETGRTAFLVSDSVCVGGGSSAAKVWFVQNVPCTETLSFVQEA